MWILVVMCVGNMATAQDYKNLYADYTSAIQVMQYTNYPGCIVFTSDECEPCGRFFRDSFHPLRNLIQERYIVYVVNVDKETEVGQVWRNTGMWQGVTPSYFLLQYGGKYVLRSHTGYLNKEDFTRWFNTPYTGKFGE